MSKRVLVTGGTVFVSRYTANWFVQHGYEVYVLNRNSRRQEEGVKLLCADRHQAGEVLKGLHFDAVLDITAYNETDILDLVPAVAEADVYILLSSSAVYPETAPQPFTESTPTGANKFWGSYGTDKIAAENALLRLRPDAYIVRPPYLYGPMNNVYREAFVFECALADRPFYLPEDGSMKLQFYMVEDLCRLFETLILKKPPEHILNAGNRETVSVRDWVTACYACAGKTPALTEIHAPIEQRQYFSFYRYEYALDTAKQYTLLADTIPLAEGLRAAFARYLRYPEEVRRKPFLKFIDDHPEYFGH